MLLIGFWLVIATLVGMTIMQLIFVWIYRRKLRKSNRPDPIVESYQPTVAVVLCVRGNDPTLVDCLTGLCIQTCSNYQIHVVSDHESDPGLLAVKQFFEDEEFEARRPQIHVFDEHADSRSLKCSAIIHVVNQLPKDIEVIALIDADVVADPNWLRDLVRPLEDPEIGASTGNRWFNPKDRKIGSLVRQAWNAGALPQMLIYSIPWGGSLAMKRTVIEQCGLLEAWSTAFCEDTLMTQRLKENGFRVHRVPNLIVANEESSHWNQTLGWITRQLLTVRLHHPIWPLVALHGATIGVCLVAPIVLSVFLFVAGSLVLGFVMLGALALFELISVGLFDWIKNGNEKIVFARGAQRLDNRVGIFSAFLRVVATQVAYVMAVFRAVFASRVSWRGVTYLIKNGKIALEAYRPYAEVAESEFSNVNNSID